MKKHNEKTEDLKCNLLINDGGIKFDGMKRLSKMK